MDSGNFNIDVTSSSQCGACFQGDNGQVTFNPRNTSGTYACGSTVNVCFTLNEFEGNASGTIEWLHSIVPTFGPGWDVSSIVPTVIPPACSPGGFWNWYPSGWTACDSGITFPRGFAFETNNGYDSSCGASGSSPGNNFGDGAGPCVNLSAPITWCWNINVRDCPPATNTFTGEDLTVNVAVYSDGDAGSWNLTGCNTGATFESLGSVVVCNDLDPLVFSTPESCPGANDGTITINPNGGFDPVGSYNLTVRNASSNAVYVCNGCVGEQTTPGLPPGDYSVEALGLANGCPRNATITIDPAMPSDASATFSDVCPGGGPIQLFGSTTTGGSVITYAWSGPNGFAASGPAPFTNDPADVGTYSLVVTVDGCPSDPFEFEVDYLEFNPMVTATDDDLCYNDLVELSVTGDGNSFVWYDPGGNIVGGNSPTLSIPATFPGTRNYLVEVSDGVCTEILLVPISTAPEISPFISNDGPECVGGTISFVITDDTGTPFPGGTTYVWNGFPDGSFHTITAAGSGVQTMTVEVTLPGGCSASFNHEFEVFDLPTVTLNPADPTICNDGSVDLTIGVTGGQPPYTTLLGPENTPGPVVTIDRNSATTSNLYGDVTDDNGCRNFSPQISVIILPELPVPNITCTEGLDEITFDWNDVGQDYFQLYRRVGAGPEQLVDNRYRGLSYTDTGLGQGVSVTIRLVPIISDNGVVCPGQEASRQCSTPACADPGWTIGTIDTLCLSAGGQVYSLDVGTADAGSITMNSSSLGLVGAPVNTSGATSITLPPLTGDTTYLVHQLNLTYTSQDGSCMVDSLVTIPVVQPASPEFVGTDLSLCHTDTTIVFSLIESYDTNTVYALSLLDPSGTTIVREEPTQGEWEIRFMEFRTHQIQLITASSSNGACQDTFMTSFALQAPPPAPLVTCGSSGLDSVVFVWNDVGADSYTVNDVDLPVGATTERTPTGYIVRGLSPEDGVTISVTAVTAGCRSATSAEVTCTAAACPIIVPMISTPVDTFCLDGTTTPVALTVTVPDPDSVRWTGPGVTDAEFDPVIAGEGAHDIVVIYTEQVCTYTDTLELVVVSPPVVTLLVNQDSICAGGSVTLESPGSYPPGAFSFDWQFPSGTTVLSGDVQGPGPLTVQFDDPGDNVVDLVVSGPFCADQPASTTVEVMEPLEPPTVDCDNLNFDQVGFVWSHPTATAFSVTIDAQPPGAVITQSGNSLLATGLAEGESVTITVRALATNICGDSGPITRTCTAQTCPGISISADAQGPFCANNTNDNTLLSAVITGSGGSGDLSWEGPGVVGNSFFVDTAGVGTHEVIGVFQEGGCTFRDTIQITVNPLPVGTLTLPNGPICVDEVILADAGIPVAGFNYDLQSPGAVLGAAPTAASQEFSWTTAGRKYVLLTVTSPENCQGAVVIDSIDVVTGLQPPNVNCIANTLTSVEFAWDTQPGVDSFRIILDGQAQFFQDSTNLVISGLNPGVNVNLEVIALGNGPCGNSAPGMSMCASDTCPVISVNPPADADFCAMTPGNETILVANQNGGSGGGTFSFDGPGVFLDNGTWRFHADTAGVGAHQLRVVYTESVCPDTAFFAFRVFDPPTSAFTMNGRAQDLTVCAGSVFQLAYAGNVMMGDNATFNWDFGVANNAPQAAFQSYEVSFPNAGTYPISLSVGRQGCSSAVTSFEITVVEPLGAPVLSCGTNTLNGTQFTWATVPGAAAYEVNVAGTLDTVNNLDYLVSGLLPGEEVNITVRALGGTVCGDGPSSTPLECFAASCPVLMPDFSNLPDQLCLENGEEFIPLRDYLVTGGSGLNAAYNFFGPGVSQDTFFAAAALASEAGETNRITLRYSEEGPCTLDTIFDITVFERPTAFITDPGPQCVGDTMLVLIGSTNFVSDQDLDVNWGGGIIVDDGDATDNSYRIYFDSPGTKTITATVTSNISGCLSEVALMMIEVSAPLPAPVMSCAPFELETITFLWDPVPGATGYEVVPADGSPAVVTTETFFVVNNRMPETTYSVTVRALGSGPCGNGPATPFTCETLPCPGGRAQATTPDGEICLDGTESSFLLDATLSVGMPTGPFTWTGTGVVDNGDGTFSFNPAGLPAGEYLSVVSYLGQGNCTSMDTVRTRLFMPPVVGFNTTPATVCVGESFNLLFNGTAADGATFVWDFDGADTTVIGTESYLVSWDTPGIKTINLLVTDNCSATGSLLVEVLPALEAPQPGCTRRDLDAVFFEWPAVAGATEGYRISINGGPFGPLTTSTDTLVSGLNFGESVSISVIAVRAGTPCDDSPASTEITCAARECPLINFAPAAAQTTFCADEATSVLLEANLTGDDGSGLPTWTGPGVVDNGNGTFSFDPSLAGTGSFLLYVDYVQETLCAYRDSLEVTVNPVARADFSTANTVICEGADLNVSLDTPADASAVYTWDFAGAQSTDLGGESYDLRWPVAGTYTVRLTVDRLGCTATDTVIITVESPPNSGTPVADDLRFCVAESVPLDLAARIVNEDAGGTWSAISGSLPAGSLNANSGALDLSNLSAGDYRFAYTVGGNSCPAAITEVDVELLAAPRVDAGADQVLTCNMGLVSLDGSDSETGNDYTYAWTSEDQSVVIMGEDQLMIDVGQPATYQLEVTNPIGCSATDEVVVTAEREAPVMELELSQITCFQSDDGAINVTNVSGGRAPYTFSLNGEDRGSNTLMAGLLPDQYEVRVTDANGCFSDVLIDISEPDALSIRLVFPGDSSIVEEGEEVFITASVRGGNPIDTLLWQPDSIKNRDGLSGIEFVARETQMISVTVVDELGCRATDNQMLLVRRNRPVYFPTAFSPNGDNNNDIFFIGANADQVVEIRDFYIFDRWGEAVFTAGAGGGGGGISGARGFPPNDPNFGWDGTLNGEALNSQVFVYTALVVFADGTEQVFKGDLVLMR